ncbi:hypothetical protein V8B97DRAFT_86453 [Scleroderma yunnanense]
MTVCIYSKCDMLCSVKWKIDEARRCRMRLFAEPAPSLPRFKALLIQGVYPSSAPIHLCLSIPPGQRAILLSPTREVLLHSLESCGDDWLRSFSGTGVTSRISSRVRVFYPPKPKHLIALLTSLCCNSGAAITDGVDPPCLLVLHEPSAYFLQENGHDHYTISSYLLLIAHARALAQFFMSRNSNFRLQTGPAQTSRSPGTIQVCVGSRADAR